MKTLGAFLLFCNLNRFLLLFSMLALALEGRAGGIVGNCTETDLHSALAGGGTVTFACDGTIGLASELIIINDTVLDGLGHNVTISGNNTARVFRVSAAVKLTLLNLTIANGRTNQGAGLYNDGGIVLLSNCTFAANQAQGTNGASGSFTTAGEPAYGGGIFNAGTLTVASSAFSTNNAVAGI